MKVVLEFLIVFFTTIFRDLFAVFSEIKNPQLRNRRNTFTTNLFSWLSAIFSIFVILLTTWKQPNGIASIGIDFIEYANNFRGAVIGFLGISTLLILYFFYQRLVLKNNNPNEFIIKDSTRPEVIDALRFVTFADRLFYLSIMPLRVIAEEFVYRGYLILLMGNRTGDVILWLIISVFFSVLAHLYQGRKVSNILLHVLFSASLGGLVLITGNIFTSITAHLFNNAAFTLNIWRLSDQQGVQKNELDRDKRVLPLMILFSIINYFAFFSFLVWGLDIGF